MGWVPRAIILNRRLGVSSLFCCRTAADKKATRPKSEWLFPFFGTNGKQAWWNKHECNAVWKSMKDAIQRREGPALDLDETEFSSIVAAGGGRYVGVLKEIPDKMESVVLFVSPRTRTTLGLPISRLTVEAVREHLTESDAAFAEAGAG